MFVAAATPVLDDRDIAFASPPPQPSHCKAASQPTSWVPNAAFPHAPLKSGPPSKPAARADWMASVESEPVFARSTKPVLPRKDWWTSSKRSGPAVPVDRFDRRLPGDGFNDPYDACAGSKKSALKWTLPALPCL
jgi:hypothetical protein